MNATRSLSLSMACSAPAVVLIALAAAACSDGGDFAPKGGPILDPDASGLTPPPSDDGAVSASDAGTDAPTAPPDARAATDASNAPDAPTASDAGDGAADADAAPTCPSATPTLCGSTCVDTTSDPAHCGDCTTACPTSSHAAATCASSHCGFACDTGYHTCGGACADDTSTASCGASCAPCPTPTHATATCDGKACGFTCDTGYHACTGACADDTSTASCGGSCVACPTPPHATATCDGKACGYTCEPGWTDCDGDASNGCEANLASDAANCGTCGHSCLAGACAASACQPGVLASEALAIRDLAVDGTNVYFAAGGSGTTQNGAVYAVQKTGGNAVQIFATTGAANGVASDATNVYGADGGGEILVWSKATKTVAPLRGSTMTTKPKLSLATGGGKIYWTTGGNEVGSANPDGTNIVFSPPNAGGTFFRFSSSAGICADGRGAFFAAPLNYKVLPFLDGWTYSDANQGNPSDVALDVNAVYFTMPGAAQALTMMGRDGTNPQPFSHVGNAKGVAVDDTYVYFTDDVGGTVDRVVKSPDGQPTRLATGQATPTNIVVDDNAIYWIDSGSPSQVMVLAK